MAELKKQGIKMEAKFLDLSPIAIQLSKKLAKEKGISNLITWHQDKVSNFSNYCNKNWRPNVIEMVGFLDYLNDEKANKLFKEIHSNLDSDGVFITANIVDNYERKFLSKVLSWDMIYRNAENVAGLIVRSGFKASDTRVFYEPCKVHCVGISKKIK